MTVEHSQILISCFASALNIAPDGITDELAYRSIPEWDSVGHMALVVEIEKRFDVMLDTNEIIDMSSVGTAKTILAKHGMEF